MNKDVLTPMVNFSMRSSFAFLPMDGYCFVDINTNKEIVLDFFDPESLGPLLSLAGTRP